MSFTLLSEGKPKARKIHTCCWCEEEINLGETYYCYSGRNDGVFQHTKVHLECKAAMVRDQENISDWGFERYTNRRGEAEGDIDEEGD